MKEVDDEISTKWGFKSRYIDTRSREQKRLDNIYDKAHARKSSSAKDKAIKSKMK